MTITGFHALASAHDLRSRPPWVRLNGMSVGSIPAKHFLVICSCYGVVKVPRLALTCDMRMCDRRNSTFILTSASWPSCDVEASISVSRRVMPARLPPQIGSRAQNRACGTLAPRAAQDASEGHKKHEIERSRRSPEAPGAAEARGRRPVDVLDRSRCRTEVLRTFDFRRLLQPSNS